MHSRKLNTRASSVTLDGREIVPISSPQVLPPLPPKSPSRPSPLLHQHCCVLAKAFTVFPLKPYGSFHLSCFSPGLPASVCFHSTATRIFLEHSFLQPPAWPLCLPSHPYQCQKPEGLFSSPASSITSPSSQFFPAPRMKSAQPVSPRDPFSASASSLPSPPHKPNFPTFGNHTQSTGRPMSSPPCWTGRASCLLWLMSFCLTAEPGAPPLRRLPTLCPNQMSFICVSKASSVLCVLH